MVNKLALPSKENDVQSKINEIIDNKQDFLTAGTDLEIVASNPLLPNGYTQLEYLESTGTQYINTGITPTISTGLKVKTKAVNITNGLIIGTMAGLNDNNLCCRYSLVVGTPAYAADFNNSSYAVSQAFYYTSSPNIVTMETSKDKRAIYSLTGETLAQDTYPVTDTFNFTLPIWLFGVSGQTNLFVGRIYSAQVYNNSVIVRDFIPAKRNSDNVLGMYDTVNDVFYTNAGSGTFNAGPELSLVINFTNTSGYITSSALPTVNNSTITLTQGGVAKGSFTLNQASDATIALDAGGGGGSLPSQTGHAGEFLTTDGSDASWAVATKITFMELS